MTNLVIEHAKSCQNPVCAAQLILHTILHVSSLYETNAMLI